VGGVGSGGAGVSGMPSDRSTCTIHVPGKQYSGVNAINQVSRMFNGTTSRGIAGYNPELSGEMILMGSCDKPEQGGDGHSSD